MFRMALFWDKHSFMHLTSDPSKTDTGKNLFILYSEGPLSDWNVLYSYFQV